MNFDSLDISPETITSLSELGITSPTSIQSLVIPVALCAKSLIARSQTGSGKTLAYLIPTIQRVCEGRRAIILSPTRELAQQIGEVCRSISRLKCVTIYGGVEYEKQRVALSENPDIIVSTVGRLVDLIGQGALGDSSFDIFILDEVDQMLDLGFRDDIIRLASLRSVDAQTLCFSATLPQMVESVLVDIMPTETLRIENNQESLAVGQIEQIGYYVSKEMMDHLLLHILRTTPPRKAILFTRSRKMADRLSLLIRENGVIAEAIHSDRSQAAREHILQRFRSGETPLLVATDVIARGIDVDDVDIIYNYGMPLEAEQYIHRIGRTARAGQSGRAVTLCVPEEKILIDGVCRLMRRHINIQKNHPYTTPDIEKSLSESSLKRGKKGKRR